MAQITFYLNSATRQRIEDAARREGISVSRWIGARLEGALDDEWPAGYFDLCGSLSGVAFERPEQPDPASDVPRSAPE